MTDEIEKLSRRRRVILVVYGIMFLSMQVLVFKALDEPLTAWRPIHYAYAVGFIGWSFTLVYILATNGVLFRGSRETARAMNDELTQANRSAGYRTGYWVLLVTGFALWLASQFFAMTVQEALRTLLAIGIAVPAIRFAILEKRQDA